jgi:hypothetical protein
MARGTKKATAAIDSLEGAYELRAVAHSAFSDGPLGESIFPLQSDEARSCLVLDQQQDHSLLT